MFCLPQHSAGSPDCGLRKKLKPLPKTPVLHANFIMRSSQTFACHMSRLTHGTISQTVTVRVVWKDKWLLSSFGLKSWKRSYTLELYSSLSPTLYPACLPLSCSAADLRNKRSIGHSEIKYIKYWISNATCSLKCQWSVYFTFIIYP